MALAEALQKLWNHNKDRTELLKRAIDLARDALGLHFSNPDGRLQTLWKLGSWISDLAQKETSAGLTDEALKCSVEALQLTSEGEPFHLRALSHLAEAYFCHGRWSGDEDALRECVRLRRKVLRLCSPDNEDRIQAMADLSTSLIYEGWWFEDVEFYYEAAAYRKELLSIYPNDSQQYFEVLIVLTELLRDIYDLDGNLEGLDEGIRYGREALPHFPLAHPQHTACLVQLGASLHMRSTADIDDCAALDETIGIRTQILECCSAVDDDRIDALRKLGESLYDRFKRDNNLGDLDRAIQHQEEVVELLPSDGVDRFLALTYVSISYKKKYGMFGSLEALHAAVRCRKEMVQLTSPFSQERASALASLGTDLYSLASDERTDDRQALDEAIAVERQVLQLCSIDDPERASALGNLSASLRLRARKFREDVSLLEAIELGREALKLTPRGHSERPQNLHDLGVLLVEHYIKTGSIAFLEEGKQLETESVNICPPNHIKRARYLRALGTTYFNHYSMTGDTACLDDAMEQYSAALELCPIGHPERADCLRQLCTCFEQRFRRISDESSLHHAIRLSEEALHLTPVGHRDRPESLERAGELWKLCYEATQDVRFLDDAIKYGRELLSLYPSTSPDFPNVLICLSNHLYERCLNFYDEHVLDRLAEALEYGEQAVEMCVPGHPDRAETLRDLAASLRLHYERTGNTGSLSRAMEMQREAISLCPPGHIDQAISLHQLVMSLEDEYKAKGSLDTLCLALDMIGNIAADAVCPPHIRLKLVRWNVDAYLKVAYSDPTSPLPIIRPLHEVIVAAIQLLPLVASMGLETSARLGALADSKGLGVAAATTALTLGQNHRAIELLEDSRAFFWTQALQLRAPLDNLPPEDAEELKRLFQLLESNVTSPISSASNQLQKTATNERGQAGKEAAVLIGAIRERPGYDRFLMGQTFNSLSAAALQGPVVVLIAQNLVCEALVLQGPDKDIKRISLPGRSATEVDDLSRRVKLTNLRSGAKSDSLVDDEDILVSRLKPTQVGINI